MRCYLPFTKELKETDKRQDSASIEMIYSEIALRHFTDFTNVARNAHQLPKQFNLLVFANYGVQYSMESIWVCNNLGIMKRLGLDVSRRDTKNF